MAVFIYTHTQTNTHNTYTHTYTHALTHTKTDTPPKKMHQLKRTGNKGEES